MWLNARQTASQTVSTNNIWTISIAMTRNRKLMKLRKTATDFRLFFFFWAQKMLTKLTVGLKQMIGALVLCKCIPWIMCHWHTLFSFGMMKSTCSWYTLNKINRFGSKYIAFIRNNIYVKENINLIAIQLPDWSIGSIWKAMHILLSGWSAPWLCI